MVEHTEIGTDLVCVIRLEKQELIKRNGIVFENLVGTKVQTPQVLVDPTDGIQKQFFIFNDISIRIDGEFQLSISIVNLLTGEIISGSTEPIVIVTPQLYVRNPSKTLLSESFAAQTKPARMKNYYQ